MELIDRETLDEAALERLYADLEEPMYNVVYRWVWSSEDARDIVQEAFVRLWNMRSRVRLETAKPLAYRIALNLASKHKRRQRIWKWISLDALRSRTPDEAAPDHRLARAELDERVRRAVEALPASLRQVVMLCELADLSYEQVAGVLSIPLGTVGSRRHRAIKQLREQLCRTEENDHAD